MKKAGVVIRQDEEKPVPREVLADAIVRIADAFTGLRKSGLNRRAIIILVAASASRPRYIVTEVLDALESLRRDYCEEKPKR